MSYSFFTTKSQTSSAIILAALICFGFTLLQSSENSTAKAQETNGRYTMIESKNGIIRLDKQTGTMSNCKKSTTGWSCKVIKGTQKNKRIENGKLDKSGSNEELFSELQKANEALHKENLILKQKIANLELGLNTPDADGTDKKKLKLPTDEEVDEAITYMEKMIRKFGGAMKRLREKHPDAPETEL